MAFINGNPAYGYSWGFAINRSGEVVGEASTSTGANHAFVYDGKKMEDLNKLIPSSKWVMFEANGINDSGQIVCTGLDAAGNQNAFLLTPR